MRVKWILGCGFAVLLCGCQTPYGEVGSLGGVKVFEISPGKVEIMVLGNEHSSYDQLARMWKVKADEAARLRGAKGYQILRFSTGREVAGVEVMGENSFAERYTGDGAFWLPRIARGVIRIDEPVTRRPTMVESGF